MISQGHLPHWEQSGKTYFITFRTADSLPVEVAERWHQKRRDWLLRHNIAPDGENWEDRLAELPERFQRQFHETISLEFHQHLDAGHGACVLRQKELAAEVGRSLRHFDGQRYRMGDFIVMPNHIHALVQFLGGTKLKKQCYSWKKFTATKINRTLGQSGTFWQKESFDHLVRSLEQFERFQRYIADNPSKAGLKEGEYLYYQRAK
ncbi:MAG: hypothetical protein B7Z73_17035 [Planctomycetia bacterium 21-64-5]|nr:MAG: hypothetical protein B7Z73_17035 [Planctomycetia bacterium 21-64-5]